jgi:KDO2-lipid IV(A) lauroyltransferase
MTLRHDLEYGAFRLVRTMWGLLPELIAVGLGAWVGWLAGSVFRVRRSQVDEHLRIAFPEESPSWRRRVARGSYMHFGREAAVLLRMGRWTSERVMDRVRMLDFDMVHNAVAEETGAVLLTGHLGNWEVGGAGMAALGLPLDVVGKGMANRRFEQDLFEIRENLGLRMIQMSDAPKGVLRSLARGRVAALLGDQNAHRNGVFLPFFGKLASTSRGPALLALRADAPIFVGFTIRDPGWRQRYTLVAERLEFARTGDLEADVDGLLLAFHARLERAIRSAPDQYFWQHRRWKTRPPEEQPSRR